MIYDQAVLTFQKCLIESEISLLPVCKDVVVADEPIFPNDELPKEQMGVQHVMFEIAQNQHLGLHLTHSNTVSIWQLKLRT